MKNILITGGSSGLGLELAKKYMKKYQVILVGRSLDKLEKAAEIIQSFGGTCEIFSCDLTNNEDLMMLKDLIQSKYESIDMLINNAGLGHFGPFESLSIKDLDEMLDLNVKATIRVTQEFMPLITNKIMNIISTAGLRGKVNEAAYVACKFAVRGFTESLQEEYKDKLTITAVYMGGMNTPFWAGSDHIKDRSRLKRPGQVADQIYEKDDGRKEIIID